MTEKVTLTVREAIAQLARVSDMDAEVCFAFFNSDPIPVTNIEENTENQVLFTAG